MIYPSVTYEFKTIPPLNEIPIEENTKEILNLRYFMEFKKDNFKESEFKHLCRRVAKVVASAEYNYYKENDKITKSTLNKIINLEDSIYNDMVSHRFLFNSPALFSAGNGQRTQDIYNVDSRTLDVYDKVFNSITENQMMFACFTLPVEDSLEGIFDSAKNAAIISKFGGGVGANFGKLREKDSLIKDGIAGKSSGPISFMQVWNTMGSVVVQGGRRRAALMGMLYSNHPDIEEFVTCKTEDGNLNYFNISVAIDDLFMQAVKDYLYYCLISPKDNKIIKTIKAKELWDNICTSAHKRGDPGIFFVDIANNDSLIKYETGKYKISSTNPCCSGDTLVATSKGYKYAKDITIDDKLITTLGIEDIKNIEVNENIDLYEIELSDGGTIKVTPSHQFQAMKFGKGKSATKKYEFIKVEDLKVGDYIRVLPTILPDNKINTFGFDDFDFGTIIGILLGDGCITQSLIDRDRIKICCDKDEIDWIREIERLLDKYNISYFEAKERNTITICINNNNNLLNMIKHYNISGYSYDKQLTLDLINSNKDVLAGILNGYISTDGNINLKSTHPTLRIDSCNKKLLEDIRYILLCFGVHNSFHISKRTSSVIEDRTVNSRNKNTIIISGGSFKQLVTNVKITNPYKARKIEEVLINYSLTGNTWKSSIKSIKLIGKETVYDFYCEKSDTWITNGYVSRGCGEQPLPDSTSCNLGSINVSEFVKDGYFDIDSFKEQILRAVYYLDLVIDATRYPLPEIEQRTKAIRPIGLGIMGLADLAIKLNIRYGSKEFIFLCEEIGRNLASMSLYGTIAIAKIKGSYDEFKNITLPLFNSGIIYDSIKKSSDNFIEPKNPFDTPSLKQIINANEDVDTRIKIYNNIYNQMINDDNLPFTFKNALEALYIDQGGDCSWLYDMFTHGLRNSRRLSIAPTGTISLILNTSSSIEPNFAYEWTRTVTVDSNTKQDMKFYHKLYNEENKQAGILPCASELSVREHVECVAEFAKWIDSGISKCVAEGTKIQTNKGIYNIEDFSINRTPDTFTDISDKDIYVRDLNGDWKKVLSHYCGGKNKTIKIHLDNGFVLECSENHKLMTSDGWKKASDITMNDVIEFRDCDYSDKYEGNKEIPFEEIELYGSQKSVNLPKYMTEKLAKWLGMIVADGSTTNIIPWRIGLTSGNKKVTEEYIELTKELFGIEPHILQDKRTNNYLVNIVINNKTLALWVYALIGSGCNNKFVPDQILHGSKSEQIAFIEGCTLDGYVAKSKNNVKYLVLFEGYAKNIRDNIYAMCRGLGLYVTMGKKRVCSTDKYTYSVRLIYDDKNTINSIESHKQIITNNKRKYKMIKVLPEYHNQLQPFVGFAKDNEVRYNRLRSIKNSKYVREDSLVNENINYDDSNYYLRIKNIEYSENNIFDIEVEDTHSYLISGVVSHNTVNLSNDATVEDVKKIYDYCYDNKIKGITIYRDGSRDNQPLKKETVKQEVQNIITNEEKIATNIKDDNYNSIRVRPKIMKGLTTKSDSPYGSIYVTANFDDNNKIFETFISAGKSGSVSKSVTEAMSRVISLALRANVDINDIIKTISNISGSELWIYDTIDGKEVYVKSIPDATAKMLADLNEYSATLSNTIVQRKKDDIKETDDIELIHSNICPECGKTMIMVSGCQTCINCGYSPCR